MTRIVLDSSCLVAAVCGWHAHHEATVLEFERLHARRFRLVIAAPALLAAYSVLTRLPASHRLSPTDTARVLQANWRKAEAVALTSGEYWQLIDRESTGNVGGGQVYDALIAACARKAGAGEILTWNVAHFAPFAVEGLAVRRPGD